MIKKENENDKNGESFLTFLARYGWSFFVVLIVVGVFIYFGIFAEIIGDDCVCFDNETINMTSTTINCTDAYYNFFNSSCEMDYEVIANGVKVGEGKRWKR